MNKISIDSDNSSNELKQIDIVKIFKVIAANKRSYFIVLPIVFVLSCALILCVPRYYTCSVSLAPELNSSSGSSLSNVAASFGVDIGSGSSPNGDAIYPDLYPAVIGSTTFQIGLFDVRVKNIEGTIDTTYYTYLTKYQKRAFWDSFIRWTRSLLPKEKDFSIASADTVNPFILTRQQSSVIKAIGKSVECDVDKKTYVITITVTDQDPLICATMADSVTNRLQQFITKYRTSKSRVDLNYALKMQAETKRKYEEARSKYARYTDSHRDNILEAYVTKRDELENDMQLMFNNYSAQTNQVQQAIAKVQENTPAFTTLQSATVPIKAAGPKRMIFVAAMLILTFIIQSLYFIFKENNSNNED